MKKNAELSRLSSEYQRERQASEELHQLAARRSHAAQKAVKTLVCICPQTLSQFIHTLTRALVWENSHHLNNGVDSER